MNYKKQINVCAEKKGRDDMRRLSGYRNMSDCWRYYQSDGLRLIRLDLDTGDRLLR